MTDPGRVISQIATVALIVGALQALYGVKGPALPKSQGETNLYSIRWQYQALGIGGSVFCIALAAWGWSDSDSSQRWIIGGFMSVMVLCGLLLRAGSVSTNTTGIRRNGLFGSKSLNWSEVTEIRYLKKQGGAIELRAGQKKLVIDFRVIAFEHLLREIEERTHLEASSGS